jgi:hypothetical protein
VAILDGDQSFFPEFVQHFLFLGEEIEVILVLELFEVNSLFCPEAEVERLQLELPYIMYISFGVACIDPYLCLFEQGWFLPYPHSQ